MDEFLNKLKELLKEVEGVDLNAIETELKALVGNTDDKNKLTVKNRELTARNTELTNKIRDLETKVAGLDAEEFERLKKFEQDTLAKGDNKIDIEDIKSKVELKWKNQLSAKDQIIADLENKMKVVNEKLESNLIDQELEKHFTTGKKVLDAHRTILKDYFKNRAKVEIDGDERTIYIKDNGQELPIADYFEFWKGTADAKTYLEADVTSGGGASGGGKGFKQKKPWKEMTASERVELYKSNPAEYNRLKAENSKR